MTKRTPQPIDFLLAAIAGGVLSLLIAGYASLFWSAPYDGPGNDSGMLRCTQATVLPITAVFGLAFICAIWGRNWKWEEAGMLAVKVIGLMPKIFTSGLTFGLFSARSLVPRVGDWQVAHMYSSMAHLLGLLVAAFIVGCITPFTTRCAVVLGVAILKLLSDMGGFFTGPPSNA